MWVDLQNRLRLRDRAAGRLEQAHEVGVQVVLARHEAGRRVGEARGHAYLLDLLAQRLFNTLGQRGKIGCRFLLLLTRPPAWMLSRKFNSEAFILVSMCGTASSSIVGQFFLLSSHLL